MTRRPFETGLNALGAAVAALVLIFALPAQAQDAGEGERMARLWCAQCHQVAPGEPATDTAPSFVAMAEDQAFNEGRLKTWLWDPHPPMPKINLDRSEIEALVAYILSLGPAE